MKKSKRFLHISLSLLLVVSMILGNTVTAFASIGRMINDDNIIVAKPSKLSKIDSDRIKTFEVQLFSFQEKLSIIDKFDSDLFVENSEAFIGNFLFPFLISENGYMFDSSKYHAQIVADAIIEDEGIVPVLLENTETEVNLPQVVNPSTEGLDTNLPDLIEKNVVQDSENNQIIIPYIPITTTPDNKLENGIKVDTNLSVGNNKDNKNENLIIKNKSVNEEKLGNQKSDKLGSTIDKFINELPSDINGYQDVKTLVEEVGNVDKTHYEDIEVESEDKISNDKVSEEIGDDSKDKVFNDVLDDDGDKDTKETSVTTHNVIKSSDVNNGKISNTKKVTPSQSKVIGNTLSDGLNEMELYNEPAKFREGSKLKTAFLPFNSVNVDGIVEDTAIANVGIKANFKFVMPKSGLLENGETMKFSIEGSDNIWVFIDGEEILLQDNAIDFSKLDNFEVNAEYNLTVYYVGNKDNIKISFNLTENPVGGKDLVVVNEVSKEILAEMENPNLDFSLLFQFYDGKNEVNFNGKATIYSELGEIVDDNYDVKEGLLTLKANQFAKLYNVPKSNNYILSSQTKVKLKSGDFTIITGVVDDSLKEKKASKSRSVKPMLDSLVLKQTISNSNSIKIKFNVRVSNKQNQGVEGAKITLFELGTSRKQIGEANYTNSLGEVVVEYDISKNNHNKLCLEEETPSGYKNPSIYIWVTKLLQRI